jgi:anti-anti-sigma factor
VASTSSVSADGREVTIQIGGRFDFSCHRAFQDAHVQHHGKGMRYVVDLADTSYMDSSALGMLLLLREDQSAGGIRITNCRDEVRGILRTANFDRLFTID